MVYTVKAVIDEKGNVRLLEKLPIAGEREAYLLIVDNEQGASAHDTMLLSEKALAEDWSRPEEDQAWLFLQPAR